MTKQVNEKNIAVVGVSTDTTKYGYRIFKDMVAAGYRVEGVNPKGGEVAGKQLHKSLAELVALDFRPDLVVTVVPPDVTERIVDQCKELGIRELWMQPGSESGNAIRTARSYGLQVTFNACIMVLNKIW